MLEIIPELHAQLHMIDTQGMSCSHNRLLTVPTIAAYSPAHTSDFRRTVTHNTHVCTHTYTQEKVVSGRSGHNRVLVLSCSVIGKSAVLGGREPKRKKKKVVWEQGGWVAPSVGVFVLELRCMEENVGVFPGKHNLKE